MGQSISMRTDFVLDALGASFVRPPTRTYRCPDSPFQPWVAMCVYPTTPGLSIGDRVGRIPFRPVKRSALSSWPIRPPVRCSGVVAVNLESNLTSWISQFQAGLRRSLAYVSRNHHPLEMPNYCVLGCKTFRCNPQREGSSVGSSKLRLQSG